MPTENSIVAAWNTASKDQQREFCAFIERLGKGRLSKTLALAPAEIECGDRSQYKALKDATNALRKGLGTRSPAAHEFAILNIDAELERKGLTRDDIVIAIRKSRVSVSNQVSDQPAAEPTSRLVTKGNGASARAEVSPAAPVSNSDDLEIPPFLRREPPRRLN